MWVLGFWGFGVLGFGFRFRVLGVLGLRFSGLGWLFGRFGVRVGVYGVDVEGFRIRFRVHGLRGLRVGAQT